MLPISSLFRRRGAGCLPDKVDDRDLSVGSIVALRNIGRLGDLSLPSSVSLRHPGFVARNQLGTQSCTGQAISQALRIAYVHRDGACPELSALAPYYWGRALWGGQNADAGSYLRQTLRAVMKLGCPDEKSWPFVVLKVNSAPPTSAIFSAARRRGTRGYYRCYGVDDMRRAIAAGWPVVGGWAIDDDFKNDYTSTIIDKVTGAITGRHAMLLDEFYADGSFGLVNSWGKQWRDNGFARVTQAFAAQAFDAWAIDVRSEKG